MNVEEVKSKVEVLENKIKQMKETNIGKIVWFSGLCLYLDLEYPPKVQVSKFEKYSRAGCP